MKTRLRYLQISWQKEWGDENSKHIVEATQVVEFLEGEKKEQWFLNIRINESPLWSLFQIQMLRPHHWRF